MADSEAQGAGGVFWWQEDDSLAPGDLRAGPVFAAKVGGTLRPASDQRIWPAGAGQLLRVAIDRR